jgi:hypothetical protein
LKQTLRIAVLLTLACAALTAFSNFAQAQKIDIAFGVSTTLAPGASFVDGIESAPSLTGGVFPGFSGDVLFWHNLGIGGEVFWRATQSNNYLPDIYGPGLNYRPVFYDINAVFSPKLASHAYLELVGGIGAQDTHFYQSGTQISGSSFISSSNHFDADFGGGIKLYVRHGLFVRPEARIYLVNNNTVYSSGHATRVGASIGYTFR